MTEELKVKMPVINAAISEVLHEMQSGNYPRWESGFGWRNEGDWFLMLKGGERLAAYEHQHVFDLLCQDILKAQKIILLRELRDKYDSAISELLN